MNTVEMRHKLREAGHKVPRSNQDLEKAYNETFNTKETSEPIVTMASSNIYTYIGQGDTPPQMIDFMGLQRFVRGQPIEVNNLEVLEKIKNHPCFVKGKANMDELFENDKKERKKAELQQEINRKIDLEAKKSIR